MATITIMPLHVNQPVVNFRDYKTINSGSNTTIILLQLANNVAFSTLVSKWNLSPCKLPLKM